MIGTLGKGIVFEVSDGRVLTFQRLSRTVAGNWAAHALIGRKPRSEFLGPALQSITFTVTLDAALGVRPRRVLEAIEAMVESGAVEYFVVGGRPVGKNPWKITSASETWGVVLSRGELLRASLDLTLEEYA